MSPRPLLSVLIPTYNGEAFLAAALDSISLQADPRLECIVVDDASTDGTRMLLESYRDRLPLIIAEQDRTGNWVTNTNRALALARGEYVCLLHQDDIWLEGRLSILTEIIKRDPQVGLFLGSAFFIDLKGRRIGTWRCPLRPWPHILDQAEVIEHLLVQNFVPIPAPVFKRDLALKLGGMDESAWYTADWDLWLKLAAAGTSIYYPRPLVGFRLHPRSQTVLRTSDPDEFKAQHRAVARKHLAAWSATDDQKLRIQRLSDLSIEVNTFLAGVVHGRSRGLLRLLGSFLQLGPAGTCAYLRDSRIWERASARLRVGLEWGRS